MQKAADSQAVNKERIDALLKTHGVESISALRDQNLSRSITCFLTRTTLTGGKKRNTATFTCIEDAEGAYCCASGMPFALQD